MADAAIRRAMLKGALSLPRPILRLASGGAAVYRGGRTLDPGLQFLAHRGRRLRPLEALTPQEARSAAAARLRLVEGGREPGVACEPVAIPSPAGEIAARCYRRAGQDLEAPLLVWAHMGGGVIGDLETAHAFSSLLAGAARCAVLSVDYRLAPEHRRPGGLEDVLAAYAWARRNAGRFGAPDGRVAIGGECMGADFAAVLCQEMKRLGEPQPTLQLLLCPIVDVASETQSMHVHAEAWPLSRSLLDWFVGHLMAPEDDPADPRRSPIRSIDLRGLAPAVIATAGFDPLADQGEAYARRLQAAGVPVTYRCYDALAHGFSAFTGAVPAADAACREIAGLLRGAFEASLA
ncbi:MAG TPA: alpha/beta hydrolase [Caulobacteraceae bacterium]|nr:alpha/beta hydrolase [Caulobacteraceae bacterium]